MIKGTRNFWTWARLSFFAFLLTLFGATGVLEARGGGGSRGAGRGRGSGPSGGAGRGRGRGGATGRRKEEQQRERREERVRRVEAARLEYARREREQIWQIEAQQRFDRSIKKILRSNTE